MPSVLGQSVAAECDACDATGANVGLFLFFLSLRALHWILSGCLLRATAWFTLNDLIIVFFFFSWCKTNERKEGWECCAKSDNLSP